MKKTVLLFLIVSIFSFSAFSQEYEEEQADDFDSIFAEAEDFSEALTTEEKAETPAQTVASAFSSMVHFSGSFQGDVGAAYAHLRDEDEGDDDVSGFFSLKNTLNMTVSPVSTFAVIGSLYT